MALCSHRKSGLNAYSRLSPTTSKRHDFLDACFVSLVHTNAVEAGHD